MAIKIENPIKCGETQWMEG